MMKKIKLGIGLLAVVLCVMKLSVSGEEIPKPGKNLYLEEKGIISGTISQENTKAEHADGALQEGIVQDAVLPQMSSKVTYPTSYDPRPEGKISDVRSQVGGTCWLYATTAAIESNLIHKGYADSKIDLSELQMAYFMKYPYKDPLGYYSEHTGDSQKGENFTDFMNGGQPAKAIAHLSTWVAPVYEEEASFREKEGYNDERAKELNGIKLDETLTKKNYFHLKGSKCCGYSTKNLTSSVRNVKYFITRFGGVTGSYYDDPTYYETYEEGGEATYYYPYSVPGPTHAIEIVGWDDNYPAENFYCEPPANGAWLCKNSWGEVYDIEWVRSNGYFWLSYYEKELTDIFAVEMDDASMYENIYSHDGGMSTGAGRPENREIDTFISVYEARAYEDGSVEKVEGVMVNLGPGTEYKVTLYANPVFADGKMESYSAKSTTVTGCTDYAGYYTIDMSASPLYVAHGKTFAVCIEIGSGGTIGTHSIHNSDGSVREWKRGICYAGTSQESVSDINDLQGESWVGLLSNRGLTNKAEGIRLVDSLYFSKNTIELDEGSTALLSATFFPTDATFRKVAYFSTDETVATVDENGKVTPVGAGECEIVGYSYDGQAFDRCRVRVKGRTFTLADRVMDVGDTIKISPESTYGVFGEEYVWEVDSDNAVIDAEGMLTARKRGSVTVSVWRKAEPEIKASCTVEIIQKAQAVRFEEKGILYLTRGQTVSLCAKVFPEDTNQKEVLYEVEQTSGWDVVEYQKKSGKLTALHSGEAILTAKTTDGSKKSDAVVITVFEPVVSMETGTVSQNFSMEAGESKTISFLVAADNPFTYCDILSATSSDESVLQVTQKPYITYSGGNAAIEIRARKPGKVSLVIKSNDSRGETLVYRITVKEKADVSAGKDGAVGTNDTAGTGDRGNKGGSARKKVTSFRVTKGNVVYAYNGKTVSVIRAKGNKKSYKLYSSVTYKGKKYTVTQIGPSAFANHTKLTSISVPAKITKIGTKAFYGCKALKKITLKGTKLKTVGKSAFKNIKKNAVIKVPAKKLYTYKKLLKGKYRKGVKVTGY